MKQWTLRFFWLIFLGSFLFPSLMGWSNPAFGKPGEAEDSPRIIVIFVDMSGSTNLARRTVYRKAFEKIYKNLHQGDRVLVGTITGRSFIDFKASVDVEIPKKTIWVNRIQFERDLTESKERIRKEVDRLLSRKRGTQRTEILNSLNIAETIFHNEKRQKILVILSDMIQDSKEYNFDKTKVTAKYIDAAVQYRQKHNLIPDLAGVKIYVAGASGADSKKFRSIEKFWASYFAKTGADFSHHRYGHSLINFEK